MEIAEKADVSVEGVVRVLTRDAVSDAVKERVLAVLDDLDPEQTRAVQRFALAALHDVLERPAELFDAVDEPPAPELPFAELPVATAAASEQVASPRQEEALVQLGSVLGELAEAVRDLRRETDAERRERVDDLAVLIDLITTGWQGLDGRLGRLERQLSRLETPRRQPDAPRPVFVGPARVEPARVEQVARAEPAPVEPPPLPPVAAASSKVGDSGIRDRLPLAAALTMVGVVIGTLAVLQLFSAGPDVTNLVSARENPTEAVDGDATTSASATTGAATTGAATTGAATTKAAATTRARTNPATTQRRPPATTSSVLGTSTARTEPAPKPRPRPAPVPGVATRPATTGAIPSGFRPTRNWAWAPVQNADYYIVEFLRDGKSFYRATPTEARLTLPDSVVFRPGPYRWVVRPGFGERAARDLGAPVVDSPFTVAA